MKRIVLLLIMGALPHWLLGAQEELPNDEAAKEHPTETPPDIKHKKALFALAYPITTDGANSRLYSYHFSFAILNNYSFSTQGFGLAGLININNADSYGFQAAGLLNYNMSGGFKGFQAASLFNTLNGYVEGVQLAGLFNFATETYGMQAATIFNIAHRSRGAQIGAIVNWSRDTTGLQLAGLVNRADHLRGLQIGLVNKATNVSGAQIGLINLAGNDAYRAIEFTFSDMLETEIVFKMGTQWFYTTFNIGARYQDEPILALGLGVGSAIPLVSNLAIATEFTFFSFNPIKKTFQTDNMAYRLSVGLNHYFLEQRLSFNWSVPLYLTRTSLESNDQLHRYNFGNWQLGDSKLNMWVGFKIAIAYHF